MNENLIYIEPGSRRYLSISQKFLKGWLHPDKPLPTIRHIFYVSNSATPEGINNVLEFTHYNINVGNTERLFHGTRCECRIGETPTSLTACTSETCCLCKIIKGSYSIDRAKGQRMFGRGIYLTRVSSKADIYVDNVGASQNKRMIVNLVALGRSALMYEASHDMQYAPPTCDSVTAATYAQGGQVNYHEAVVYREDAICPRAIVVYS